MTFKYLRLQFSLFAVLTDKSKCAKKEIRLVEAEFVEKIFNKTMH